MITLESSEIKDALRETLVPKLVEYAKIPTTSDPKTKIKDESGKVSGKPSTEMQWKLIHQAAEDLRSLGLEVEVDDCGYVYGILRGNSKESEPVCYLAHVDTTNDVPDPDVKPLVRHFTGEKLSFPDNPELFLDPATIENLERFKGTNIVTASGKSLLGADDKAGMSEIYSILRVLKLYPGLPHPDVVVCFTHDEEIGHGIDEIDLARLPKACYTFDGGLPGGMEVETWDAYKVIVSFNGVSSHAGAAKGKMHNSIYAMAEFALAVRREMPLPEETEGRDGFVHAHEGSVSVEKTELDYYFRDFDKETNLKRIEHLKEIAKRIGAEFPTIKIDIDVQFQYPNMIEYINTMPSVKDRAIEAIERSGLKVTLEPIRGGTDGSKLSAVGHPCPNLPTGMQRIHSTLEWISEEAMLQSAMIGLHLLQIQTEK